jgi:hypothetical protein
VDAASSASIAAAIRAASSPVRPSDSGVMARVRKGAEEVEWFVIREVLAPTADRGISREK